MKRMGFVKGLLRVVVVLVMLAGPLTVWADNPAPDGDGAVPIPFSGNPMELGEVCAYSAVEGTALIAIRRQGGNNVAFQNSSTVTISVQSVAGAGLSATIGTPDSIALPGDWVAQSANTVSTNYVTSTLKLETGAPGAFSGVVTYRASGTNANGQPMTRDATMNVTATVVNCGPTDTTPPTADPTQDPEANANGWNNTDVTITWNWADEKDGSGIDEENCELETVATEEGAYEVTATCSDLAGNEGTATYAVKIDKTAPTISGSASPGPNANGWNNSDVAVTFACADEGGSGIASCGPDVTLTEEGAEQAATGTAMDLAGNSATATVSGINIDKTAPEIEASLDKEPDEDTGWYNIATGAPTVSFACSDALSGIASCPSDYEFGEGEDQSHSGTAYDNAGNSATATVEDIDVDLTAPGIQWDGDIEDGDEFYFGSVPAAPTCTATDELSGPDTCVVTGYATTVGEHTLTATATDVAGNETVETRTYTVLAWTMTGFYRPVEMDGAWNIVKGNSTVPLKFNVFAGTTELTSPTVIVQPLRALQVSCTDTETVYNNLELTATGNTALRYDAAEGQFIYNWKVPKNAGLCYMVTVGAQDGSALTAFFQTK